MGIPTGNMGPQQTLRDFRFILSTDVENKDSDTRKVIRSHVMRGKNRIKPRRKGQQLRHQDIPKQPTLGPHDCICPPKVPRPLCSDLAIIPFDDAVEPALIADVLLFSSMSSKAMFLLDPYIVPRKDDGAQEWFSAMLSDMAYLNAMCFTIQSYFDGLFGRIRSFAAQQRDRLYYAKTIRIIQDRLSLDDDNLRLSDSTIMTILVLSGHAYTTGDYESAHNHCSGLLRLVSMRGIDTFLQNIKLSIEIIRCDLAMAVDTNLKPVLSILGNTPRVTTRPGQNVVRHSHFRPEVIDFLSKLNAQLAAAWVTMSHFCAHVNAAAEEDGPRVTEETFLHNMISIMYPLLHQCYQNGSIDEAVRLGLLAFSSPLFLHWNRIELPDRRFTSAYREALAGVALVGADISPRERLWLFMMGALSMSHEPESISWLLPMLRMNIEQCGLNRWSDMQEVLKSLLWVGLVYDVPGKEVFELMFPDGL